MKVTEMLADIHPAATLFPMMTDEEYRSLVDDIRTNGLAEPVVYWCNKLLDGRNRLRACDELGITPESVELDEDVDPYRYVLSHNLHRRHLTQSQKALSVARRKLRRHMTSEVRLPH